MAKLLKDILAGKKSSTVVPGSTGTDAGVDYKPKAGDEAKFVAKHKTEKHADRVGNDDDVYSGGTKEASYKKQTADVYENKNINELSKGLLRTYGYKALFKNMNKEGTPEKIAKRTAGINLAVKKIQKHNKTNEEMEIEIAELSAAKLKQYSSKAADSAKMNAMLSDLTPSQRSAIKHNIERAKRERGISMASDKLTQPKESVEPTDQIGTTAYNRERNRKKWKQNTDRWKKYKDEKKNSEKPAQQKEEISEGYSEQSITYLERAVKDTEQCMKDLTFMLDVAKDKTIRHCYSGNAKDISRQIEDMKDSISNSADYCRSSVESHNKRINDSPPSSGISPW